MEECEALCERLVIMVNGTFRCIGYLKIRTLVLVVLYTYMDIHIWTYALLNYIKLP